VEGTTPVEKTAAELRFEETNRERLEERAAKTAEKSHKDRVNEFNSYLSRLSEHHDIRNSIFNN
jgi:protein FAM32A